MTMRPGVAIIVGSERKTLLSWRSYPDALGPQAEILGRFPIL